MTTLNAFYCELSYSQHGEIPSAQAKRVVLRATGLTDLTEQLDLLAGTVARLYPDGDPLVVETISGKPRRGATYLAPWELIREL